MKATAIRGSGWSSFRTAVYIIQTVPMLGEMNKTATRTISILLWGYHGPITIHAHRNPRPPIRRIQKANFMGEWPGLVLFLLDMTE